MINVLEFSKEYEVRKMGDSDAENILNLCCGNGQFYRYCEAKPTIEQVLNDLHITPPNISMSDKYYVGFYEDKALVAVMDLIDGYPNADIAYIGFFMMNQISRKSDRNSYNQRSYRLFEVDWKKGCSAGNR